MFIFLNYSPLSQLCIQCNIYGYRQWISKSYYDFLFDVTFVHCTVTHKALAIAIRTIAIAIAIVAKKAIEYCNMQ